MRLRQASMPTAASIRRDTLLHQHWHDGQLGLALHGVMPHRLPTHPELLCGTAFGPTYRCTEGCVLRCPCSFCEEGGVEVVLRLLPHPELQYLAMSALVSLLGTWTQTISCASAADRYPFVAHPNPLYRHRN